MNRTSALKLMDRERRSETGIRRPRFLAACLPHLTFDGNRVRPGEADCLSIHERIAVRLRYLRYPDNQRRDDAYFGSAAVNHSWTLSRLGRRLDFSCGCPVPGSVALALPRRRV
jgi:hypothetical protein